MKNRMMEIPIALLAMSLAAMVAYFFVAKNARAETPKNDPPLTLATSPVATPPDTPKVVCPVVNADDYIEAALDVPVAERIYIVRAKNGGVVTCRRGERVNADN